MDVLQVLDSLAQTTKKNEKISILSQHKDNLTLKRVLKLSLCPYTQYNIKRIPPYTCTSLASLDSVLDLVEANLVNRAITGSIAKLEFLETVLSSLSNNDAEVLCRVIKKDLRAGIAESTVNKVFPGLIPSWPCLLADAYNQKTIQRIKFPAICQLKSDGTRINIIVKDGVVEYRGRSGKEFDFLNMPDQVFLDLASKLNYDGVVFDGECLVESSTSAIYKRETGNGIISKALKGSMSLAEANSIRFDLWDVIPYSDFCNNKCLTPYQTRLSTLKYCIDSTKTAILRLIESSTVNSLEDALTIYETYLAAGFEGAVLKNNSMIWEDKRSKDQIKLKAELECEVLVTGVNPGNGKYTGLIGSLMCKTADGVIVDVSGFDDEFRKMSFNEIIGKIITVKYNGITEDSKSGIKSLFLPRFVELRHDKSVPDSIL